jgi:hypothetical protein
VQRVKCLYHKTSKSEVDKETIKKMGSGFEQEFCHGQCDKRNRFLSYTQK